MARKVYEESHIAAIADKIREKTGGSTTYKTSEMSSGVDEVYEAGYAIPNEKLKGLIDGSITEVEIPEGLTKIRDYAFGTCYHLLSAAIPDSVTSIGQRAFYNCDDLESIILPKNLTTLWDYAFLACTGLTDIIIPKTVSYIGSGAFSTCTGLKKVLFKGTPTTIKKTTSIFYGCSNITDIYVPFTWSKGQTLGAPWGATNAIIHWNYIIDDAGLLYSNLSHTDYYEVTGYEGTDTTVVIPDTYDDLPVKVIATDALRDKKTVNGVSIGSNIITIGYASFMNCGVKSVIIPKSVTEILAHAFRTGWLTEVTFEENSSLTTLASSCFYGAKFSNITLPSSVMTIEANVFKNCTNLTKVTFEGAPNNVDGTIFTGCTSLTDIYVPWSSDEHHGEPWSATNATIHYNS